jgi:uncharacterized protein YjbJ (UPF0337 family)
MDENRVEGAVRGIGGQIKEAVGDLTGDAKTQAEGRVDQIAGRVQNAYGSARDGAEEMGEVVSETIRAHPLAMILVVGLFGFLLGRR